MTYKGQGNGDIKIIKVEGESNKEKEVIVRHETVPRRKGRSTWNQHKDFAIEWSKTFITNKREINPKQGE